MIDRQGGKRLDFTMLLRKFQFGQRLLKKLKPIGDFLEEIIHWGHIEGTEVI